MPECPVCGDTTFDEVDGFFFCSTCHTQSQNIRAEETADFVATRGLALTRERLAKATPERTRKQAKCGRPWEIVEAYTIILKEQTEALIELGVNPKIKETVFHLWKLYLSLTGNAFNNEDENEFLLKVLADMKPRDRDLNPATVKNPQVTAVGYKKTMKKNQKGNARAELERKQLEETLGHEDFYEGDNPFEFDEEEDDDEDGEKHLRLSSSAEYRRITRVRLKLLPSLCYVGLLFCHNLVTASDVSQWLSKGLIPYKNSDILPEDMKFTAFDSHMFTHATVPNPSAIRKLAGKLICFLTLKDHPTVDLRPLANKYLLQLFLPSELQTLVGALILDSGPMFNMRFQKKDGLPIPEAVAMAFIVIVLKMLFVLDDEREVKITDYARDINATYSALRLFVWDDWVKQRREPQILEQPSHLPEQLSDVLKIKDVSSCLSSQQEKGQKKRHSVTRGLNDMFERTEVRENIEKPLKAVAKTLPRKTKLVTENTASPTQGSSQHTEDVLLRPADTLEFDINDEMNEEYDQYLSQDELFQRSTVKYISDGEAFVKMLKDSRRKRDAGPDIGTQAELLDLPHHGCSPYIFYKEGAKLSKSYVSCLDICSKLISCESSDIHSWVQRLEWKIFKQSFTTKESNQCAFQYNSYLARLETD